RQDRLHDGVATLAMSDFVFERFRAREQMLCVEFRKNLLSCFESIEPLVGTTFRGDLCVLTDDRNLGQSMALSHVEIRGIVSRRHFDNAGSKVAFDEI